MGERPPPPLIAGYKERASTEYGEAPRHAPEPVHRRPARAVIHKREAEALSGVGGETDAGWMDPRIIGRMATQEGLVTRRQLLELRAAAPT